MMQAMMATAARADLELQCFLLSHPARSTSCGEQACGSGQHPAEATEDCDGGRHAELSRRDRARSSARSRPRSADDVHEVRPPLLALDRVSRHTQKTPNPSRAAIGTSTQRFQSCPSPMMAAAPHNGRDAQRHAFTRPISTPSKSARTNPSTPTCRPATLSCEARSMLFPCDSPPTPDCKPYSSQAGSTLGSAMCEPPAA